MQRTDRAAYDTLQEHNFNIVTSNLDPLRLADELFGKTIISEDVQEQVIASPTKQARLRLLLQAVRGNGREGVFQDFVKAILAVPVADWLGKKLIETYKSKGGKWKDELPLSGQPPAGSHASYHPQVQAPEPETKDLQYLPIKDWYALGLELGLKDFDLEVIRNDEGGMQGRIRKMFQAWLSQFPNASYQQLVNALCKIKENTVASDLCKKYPGLRMPMTQQEMGPQQPQHEYQQHTATSPPGQLYQGQPPSHYQGQPTGQFHSPYGQPGPPPQGYYYHSQHTGQFPPLPYAYGQPGPPPQGYYTQSPTGQFFPLHGQQVYPYSPPASQPHFQIPPSNQLISHQGQSHSGGVLPGATLTAPPGANSVPAVQPQSQANGHVQTSRSGGGQDSTSTASGNTAIYRHGKPMLRQLKKFPGQRKTINIVEHIAISNDFGTYLLQDDEGVKVPRIIKANRHDPALVADAILREWIAGKGVVPVTWETLLECLRDAELNTLAKDIEEVLQ